MTGLLCTSLHLAERESNGAGFLLTSFVTPSFEVDGFLKRPDFILLAQRFWTPGAEGRSDYKAFCGRERDGAEAFGSLTALPI